MTYGVDKGLEKANPKWIIFTAFKSLLSGVLYTWPYVVTHCGSCLKDTFLGFGPSFLLDLETSWHRWYLSELVGTLALKTVVAFIVWQMARRYLFATWPLPPKAKYRSLTWHNIQWSVYELQEEKYFLKYLWNVLTIQHLKVFHWHCLQQLAQLCVTRWCSCVLGQYETAIVGTFWNRYRVSIRWYYLVLVANGSI